jgi:hypothetical protein
MTDSTGVGLVTGEVGSHFVANDPPFSVWIREATAEAEAAEFSHYSKHIGGHGFCLAGDAFSSLELLFSSSVFLALKSGEFVADAIHPALSAGEPVRAIEEYRGREARAEIDATLA